MAPVTSRLTRLSGSIAFQPRLMSWSYRGRGNTARMRMKMLRKMNVLSANQMMPGSQGPSQPPKNSVTMSAETRRIPFDLVEAESELVAGYHTEYSGMKFGIFLVGEYVAVTLISALIVTLFFGGWLGPWLPGVVWFLLKTFVFISLFIIVRGTFPRPRYDQLMALGWKAMLPLSLLNLLITGAIVVARAG